MIPTRELIAFAAAVAATALSVSLGNWQMRRAEQKQVLQSTWDGAERAQPVELVDANLGEVAQRLPLRVALRGRLLPEHEIWLDNRFMNGRAGLMLIVPMSLGDGTAVLVNRGFAARDSNDRGRLPIVARPVGEVVIEGIAVAHTARVLALGDNAPEAAGQPRVWQNLDFDAFERVSSLAVPRWVVQQTGGDADGLLRNWPRPDAGVDKHRGYALQWYSLAALIVALTLFFGVRALRGRARPLRTDE